MSNIMKKIQKEIYRNNPMAVLETAKILINKDITLNDEEKFVVRDMVDSIIGEQLLNFDNSYLVEKNINKIVDSDVLRMTARKYFLDAYKRVYK